jgi:hypothetical protein
VQQEKKARFRATIQGQPCLKHNRTSRVVAFSLLQILEACFRKPTC